MAALWFTILVPLFFVVAESQSTSQLNRTDLQVAMADMRARSYNGFVILLKILEGSPNFVQSSDVTFLMPNDEKLSAPELSLDHIQNLVLAHTIPSALVFNSMLHFPNGTLVPTSLPGRMLSINNNHGLFLNNARIVNANVCVNSLIKCHGISSAISLNNGNAANDIQAPPAPTTRANNQKSKTTPPPTTIANDQKKQGRAKPSLSIHLKRKTPLS